MQFAGYPIQRSNARGYNCAATNVTSFNDIADILWLSMNGCGVGFSVQHSHIRNLPVISAGDASERMMIPDSKEGWADSIKRLLLNPLIRFDYSPIRQEGVKLSTGGTASGPKPLRDAHQHIRRILKAAVGRQLTSLEVHDIVCHQSDAVVVGGVRRAALISLFDASDSDMLRAKSGDNFTNNPQRQRANNSAVIYRQDPKITNTIRDVMEEMFRGGFGEPGIYISNNLDMLCNPCQPSWATLLTPNGIKTMGEVEVGSTIWSGKQWTKITNKVCTGVKPVYAYRTAAGTFFGTEQHRVIQNGERVEVRYADAIDTTTGPVDLIQNGIEHQDIMDGLVVGDGTIHKASNNKVLLCVGVNDYIKHPQIKDLVVEPRSGIRESVWDVKTTITADELGLTNERRVPARFRFGSQEKMIGFLRGLYSANGSVVADKVTLKTGSFQIIEDVQQMLSSIGISSYYMTNKSKNTSFPNGEYMLSESYDLNITTDRSLFRRYIGFLQADKAGRLQDICASEQRKGVKKTTFEIIEREFIREEPVFDITVEADEHTYWTGGLLVSNCVEIALLDGQKCNLTEINAAACRTPEEFYHAASVAALIGTLQASYTDFPYLQGKWRRNCEAEALLGVSITGQAENWGLLSDSRVLREAAQVMLRTNEIWARKLGINPAARIGCTKPSGSASTYLGTTPGIHGAYDDHFLRRMQIDRGSPLARYLVDVFGERDPGDNHPVEAHNHKKNLIVVSAPHAATNAIIAGKESAIDLLDRAHHIKKNWIEPSHRSGDNTHNVSLTCYYKPNEKAAVIEWMQGHADAVSGVAFFPHSGTSGMVQTPYESITSSQFDQWCGKFDGVSLNLNEIDFRHAEDLREGEMACAGGACDALMDTPR
jgi:hypothetical protein